MDNEGTVEYIDQIFLDYGRGNDAEADERLATLWS